MNDELTTSASVPTFTPPKLQEGRPSPLEQVDKLGTPEMFDGKAETVTGDGYPTPEERLDAYNAGYFLRGKPSGPGWTATLRKPKS